MLNSTDKWALSFLYSLFVHLLPFINFSSLNFTSLNTFCFLALFWDTVQNIFVSVPSNEHLDIQQLAHSLLQTQPITVHTIKSLARPMFVSIVMYIITDCLMLFRVTQWMFINLHLTYFFLSILMFQFCFKLRDCLGCNGIWFPCNFLFLVCLLLQMLCLVIGPFILMVLSFFCPLAEPGQVLSKGFIKPYRNFRQLH